MFRAITLGFVSIVAASLLQVTVEGQDDSSRRTPSRTIEQEDIFDRLVPLVEATTPTPIDDPVPDSIAPDEIAPVEVTPEAAAVPDVPFPVADASVAKPPAANDAAQLIKSLAQVPTGGQWREYLELDRVATLLASPRPLSLDQRSRLQMILPRYEKAAVEPAFKKVVALPGFAATYRQLQAAVAVVPSDVVKPIDAPATAGKPIPDGKAPTLRLLSEAGLAYHHGVDDAAWKLIDNAVTLASGDAIKTNQRGTARLIIGTSCEIICSSDTTLRVARYVDEDRYLVTQLQSDSGNLKVSASAAADLSPAAEREFAGERLVIVYQGHQIIAEMGELELDFRHFSDTNRVVAAVYAGDVHVLHDRTGDEATIRAGREAVILPAGIAVRAAAEKPVAWWPPRNGQDAPAQTALENNGFSR